MSPASLLASQAGGLSSGLGWAWRWTGPEFEPESRGGGREGRSEEAGERGRRGAGHKGPLL